MEDKNKLKAIVPDTPLCKLIPEGEFEDSALVLACQLNDEDEEEVEVFTRDMIEHLEERHGGLPYTCYPAPTIEEILQDLDNIGEHCPTVYRLQNQWYVDCGTEQADGTLVLISRYDVDKAANAAINLWLSLKGVKYGQ